MFWLRCEICCELYCLQVAEELGRTPLSEQNTPRSDRKTPSKAQLSTPNKTPSRQSTPAKGILRYCTVLY